MDENIVGTVRRSSLSQQVLEKIIHLLINGQLKPGDKLPPEMNLMVQLDVSRPVLREALSSLETLEIITRKPREGTFVNDRVGSNPFTAMLSLSINNIPALIEARMALELGLVTIAAERISEDQLRQLKNTITSIMENAHINYGVLDKEFHRIIAHSADNPVLEGMITSLLIVHEKTDSLIKHRDPDITVEHHLAIYEGIGGDGSPPE